MNYRNTFMYLALSVGFLATACIPAGGTQQPDWIQGSAPKVEPNRNRMFQPCRGIDSEKPEVRAFAAMVLSLQEREWIVQSMDPGQKKIEGEKCWRTRPSLCVLMLFEADEWGRVKAMEQAVPPNLRDDLERWLGELEQTFSKFRCYTNDALAAEMENFGISM